MPSIETSKQLNWIQDIERSYDLQVEAIIHMRSVVGIRSRGQNYIVKNLGSTIHPRRIYAMAKALDQLYRLGAPVCPILRTQTGRTYIRSHGNLYILQPWISGRHVDFTNKDELIKVVDAVADLHARPVVLPNEWAEELEVPSIVDKYLHRLRRCQKMLHQDRHIWRDYLDPAVWSILEAHAFDSIESMKQQCGANKRSSTTVSFCHRDLAPHNVLIRDAANVTLIDFDLAGFDRSMHDLYQIMNHTMYLHGWNENDIPMILEAYDQRAGITQTDLHLLYSLLRFPSLFTRELYDQSRLVTKSKRYKESVATRIQWALEIEQCKQEWLQSEGKQIFFDLISNS